MSKKAGNNFILEIGKMQGTPLKVENEQRNRSLDIYAPFARSINYEINIQVPDGYTVEGVNALNKNVSNETGYFTCEAVLEGKMLSVKVRKAYNRSLEPTANWEKLLAFIDAANEWSNARILLKKI